MPFSVLHLVLQVRTVNILRLPPQVIVRFGVGARVGRPRSGSAVGTRLGVPLVPDVLHEAHVFHEGIEDGGAEPVRE